MGTVETIALTLGVGWASGLNLYAAVCVLGLLANGGYVTLPETLSVVQDPLVITIAGVMYCVEFFADKVPGLDSAWDGVHSFIRIPVGAILASQAVGDVSAPVELIAGLLGGSAAAGSHLTKSGTRAMINVSPEPVSNWTASIMEDIAVVLGLFAALHYPWIFLVFFTLFVVLMIWLLPKLWRGVKAIYRKITGGHRKQSGANTVIVEQSEIEVAVMTKEEK